MKIFLEIRKKMGEKLPFKPTILGSLEEIQNKFFKKKDKIKKDPHGNCVFYNLIKGIALELGRLVESIENDKVAIIIKYIERILDIDYEIDIYKYIYIYLFE